MPAVLGGYGEPLTETATAATGSADGRIAERPACGRATPLPGPARTGGRLLANGTIATPSVGVRPPGPAGARGRMSGHGRIEKIRLTFRHKFILVYAEENPLYKSLSLFYHER